MKNQLLLLALLFSSFLQAQPTINWGPTGKEDKIIVTSILGQTDDNIVYSIAVKKKDYYLEKYDSGSLKKKSTSPLQEPKVNGKKADKLEVLLIGKTPILFASYYDKKAKTNTIYGYKVKDNGKFQNAKGIKLLTVDVEKKKRRGNFGIAQSDNQSKLVVYITNRFKKEKKQKTNVKVFNENLELENEVSIDFPLETSNDEDIEVSKVDIDKKGNIYVLLAELKKKKKVYYLDYKLYAFDKANDNEKKVYKMTFSGKRVVNLNFAFDKEDNLNVGGYFLDESKAFLGKYDAIAGIFFMYIDNENKEVVSKKLYKFKAKDKAEFLTAKQIKKKRGIPADYVPREIIKKESGGWIMIAESFTHDRARGNMAVIDIYNYGPIMVININADGSVKWVKNVMKRQYYTNSQPVIGLSAISGGVAASAWMSFRVASDKSVYLSFLTGVKEDKMYFVFNDNPKNEGLKDMEDYKMLKQRVTKSIPFVVTLSEDGEMTREILEGGKEGDTIFMPRVNKEVGEGELLIYGSRKKSERLGRLTF